MPHEFRLPDLGEGLQEAILVDWKVKEGEQITADQTLAEVETDKATATLPSPIAGKIIRLHYRAGDTVPVGAVLVSFEGDGGGRTHSAAAARQEPRPPAEVRPPGEPRPSGVSRASVAGKPIAPSQQAGSGQRPVLAAPATRKLAREHGVDLHQVRGTGPGGRVTAEDVRSFVAAGGRATVAEDAGSARVAASPRPALPDFSKWGPVVREKASPIRRRIAQRLSVAFHAVVPVTHMDEADVTALELSRVEAAKRTADKGVKLTILPCVVKAAVAALKRHPHFNASFDEEAGEIIRKEYFHIGIAVDSPQGLLVPVIRDADKKSLVELAREIAALAEKARTGALTLEEMRGGTFTITNIGALGGTAFTPVINWPESAILGMARIQDRPAIKNGVLAERKVLPLMLTFDHRLTDGAQAARFLNEVRQQVENPVLLMLEG